ncbi:putative Tachykinin family protein [Seiridium cardinale]
MTQVRRQTYRSFLHHKQYAIALLQTNLFDSVEFQAESAVATVVLLLLIESLSGDSVTAHTHRSGLVALAKRYDMAQKSSHLMTSDILMSDIKSAVSTLSHPSMSPCLEWSTSFDELKHIHFTPCQPEFNLMGTGFMITNISHHLGPNFVQLVCGMRNLINSIEHNFNTGICASGINGTHVLVLEYELLSFPNSANRNGISSGRLIECCQIGALLYCNLFLWTWPKGATLVENLLSRLRATISQLTLESHVWEQSHVLLWLSFMATCATSSEEERQWYLRGMADASERLGLEDKGQLRSVLASFFYVDRLMGRHLQN